MTKEENNEINVYERLNSLKNQVDKLKKEYKIVKENFDNGMVTEEEKKAKSQLLLSKEYEYQQLRDSVSQKNGTYTSPKIGDWIVTKNRWGFRRVKIMADDNCGWS